MVRRRKRKIISFKKIFYIILIAGSLIGVYRFLYTWKKLSIKTVKVIGIKRLNKDKFKKVFENKHILKIDIGKIKKRFESMDGVRNVVIKKRLPNKILIEIKERKPIAMIKRGKEYLLMDVTGKIFDKKKNEHYPLIKGRQQIDNQLKAINLYADNKVTNWILSSVIVKNKYDVCFVFKGKKQKSDKITVNLGRKEFSPKLKPLNQIFERKSKNTVKIDLRFLPYVIFKFNGGV